MYPKFSGLQGKLQTDASLAAYTSWQVGGPARLLFQPTNNTDLSNFLQQLPQAEPLLWLGLGSNTLIRDSGFAGTVVVTQTGLNKIEVIDEYMVRAEAGVASPALARYCARQGWEGLEFLAGVPGTVGGALAMNAGCHGGETWQYVTQVETMDRHGTIRIRPASDYAVAYRKVSGVADEWFIAGYFRLTAGNKEQSLERIRELLAYRSATQPTSEPSCGSVFRNPPGDYAARLIEACGLKGKQIGGALVSPKHANFIVHHGTASASDIEHLINYVAAEVSRVHHVELIREVHILGG